MGSRPMVGDVELPQVQQLECVDDQLYAQHAVPALEGDFLQSQGRRAARVVLAGVLTGPDAGDGVKALRDKFRAAEPVDFTADITTATKVDRVVIEEMDLRDLAGKPERFEYFLILREVIPEPRPEQTTVPPQVDEEIGQDAETRTAEQAEQVATEAGTLEVEVAVADEADYAGIVVVIEGETSAGEPFSATSQEQTDGVYRFENLDAGTYTVSVQIQ